MKITKEEKITLKGNRFSNAFLFFVSFEHFVVRSYFLVDSPKVTMLTPSAATPQPKANLTTKFAKRPNAAELATEMETDLSPRRSRSARSEKMNIIISEFFVVFVRFVVFSR